MCDLACGTLLNLSCIFEWYVAMLVVKNEHQNVTLAGTLESNNSSVQDLTMLMQEKNGREILICDLKATSAGHLFFNVKCVSIDQR